MDDVKQYINIETVKSLMKSKGIDEKELAKHMSVTLPTIKKLLSGADQRRMSATVLYELAMAFGVTMQSLLNEQYCHDVPLA